MVASPKQQVLVHWCSSCARKLGSGRRERTKSSLKSVIGESVNPYIPTVSLSQTAHIGPHNSSYLPDTYEYVSYSSYRSLFIVQCYGSIPVRTRLHIDSITLFTDTCYVVPVPDTHLIPQVLGYLGREAERERERERAHALVNTICVERAIEQQQVITPVCTSVYFAMTPCLSVFIKSKAPCAMLLRYSSLLASRVFVTSARGSHPLSATPVVAARTLLNILIRTRVRRVCLHAATDICMRSTAVVVL